MPTYIRQSHRSMPRDTCSSKINKTWLVEPTSVNAYYYPPSNGIVISAAITQSPVYDKNRPAFMNYGALGVVVGHEINHGFDNLVLLIEVRHLQPTFYIKVVRSPDGESRSYAIGQLSIQRAAVWVLEKYYTEFPIYNPYLERLPVSKSGRKQSSFKFYEVDGGVTGGMQSRGGSGDRAVLAAQARRRDSSHNERFYEEHDYERRVRKRRARLVTAAEEAFAHIKRLHSEVDSTPNPGPMDPMEAAQAVFPSMARALQKYLRITRQQPRHSVESILNRLARCLAQDAAPRAFLEPFFAASPVLSNEKERQKRSHHWALVCEGELPSRPIANG
ncbi:Vang-like protein, partial [Temnothorax longispinosus]